MKLASMFEVGHLCQRTIVLFSLCPGWIADEATSTSLIEIAGAGLAAAAGVPPPNRLRASNAAAPAAIAATARMSIRGIFMGVAPLAG
jgi:hypothetical protein